MRAPVAITALVALALPASASAMTVSPTHVRFPQIAVDGHGRTVVAWQRQTQGRFVLEVRRGGSPLRLRPAQLLTRSSEGPRVAIGDDGSAAVMWSEFGDHGSRSLRVAVARPGHSFGRGQLLDRRTANIVTVGVAIQPNGRVVAVWTRKGGRVGYALAPRGKAFGTARDLTDFSQSSFPSIALDRRDGAVLVAYGTALDVAQRSFQLAAVRTIKPTEPAFSEPTLLTTAEARPAAIAGPAGSGVAYTLGGRTGTLNLARRAADGGWPTRERIAGAAFTHDLQVTLPTGGAAVAAWSLVSKDSGGHTIGDQTTTSVAPLGGLFSAPKALTPANATFGPPALVAVRGESFVASAQKDGPVRYARCAKDGASFGRPTTLTRKGDGDVVLAAGGSHLVAGYQQGDRLRLKVLL